jgi:hypothetical protein
MKGALDIHPKVAGGTLSGSLAVLIVWILSLRGIAVPDVAIGALVVFFTAVGGWLAPAGYPASTTPAAAAPEEPAA